MRKVFITYGDAGYEKAKERIVRDSEKTHEFQIVISCDRDNLSRELLESDIIKVKRGGGLWSWKPDIILSMMSILEDGDIIVYCDAGCSLYPSKEWSKFWRLLDKYDIIAQRIFQRTDKWTRKEILDLFRDNGKNWSLCYQYQATIVLKVSSFTRRFVSEWRDLMINNPVLAMDVLPEERIHQHRSLIENRHDQAIYSALVYKYLSDPRTRPLIYTQWEHIENYDPIFRQAIRATRLRQGEEETRNRRFKEGLKRLVKDYIYKPFFYAPLQWCLERDFR